MNALLIVLLVVIAACMLAQEFLIMQTAKGSIIRPCFDGVPNTNPPRKARVAMMPWRVTEISPNGDARAHPLGSDSSEALFFKSWVLKTP